MPLPRLAWPARAASPPGVVQRSGQRVGAGIIEQVLRKDRLQGVAAVEIVARLVGLVAVSRTARSSANGLEAEAPQPP
jgi:hypothetical protein